MTRHRDPLPPHALAAYLEGEVTPSETAIIEAHLRDSGAARGRLDQLDEIRRTLARLPEDPDEPLAQAALWRAVDAAPARPRAVRSPWWRALLGFGAAACATLCAVLLLRAFTPPVVPVAHDSEFQRKAAAAIPDDRWVHIEVLRVATDGTARPLPGGVVRAGDKLVFRYASGGPDPFGFLMVFAVDAAQDIHWYYPAYETAGSDPASVAIRGDGGAAALPDAIEHPLPAGPLVFYGVFTRTPLRVVDVERRVAATLAREGWHPDLPPRLPIDISGQHLVGALVGP